MRCKNCDYALWNLTERTCPECGTSFKPSEFEFVPGNVVYRCLHCAQEYVGTGEHGHLEPPQFDCTQCGERISMDEMALRIGDELSDRDTRPGLMPWLERRHRGRLKAFVQTIGMALVRPQSLIRGVPRDASVGESLVFGFTTTVLLLGSGLLVTIATWVLGFQGPLSILFGGGGGMGGLGVWFALIWVVAYGLFGLLLFSSLLMFWPMVIHATLRLTGGCKHGIDRTFQAFGYSAGANALSAIPCVGIWIGVVWWMVSATLMVRAGQRVNGVRAALAVLALPLLIVGLWFGVVGLSIYAQKQVAASMAMGGGTFNPQQQQTANVTSNVTSSMWNAPGRTLPTHTAELLLTNPMLAMVGNTPFIQPGTKTLAGDVPIGGSTLRAFPALTRAQQLAEIKAELDKLPPSVVAHRFGDFVFTYHGYSAGSGMGIGVDPQLWIVVMIPDPAANGAPTPRDDVHIGLGSQMVITTTYKQLAADLKKQNTYRATLGLPPLPDLATVTHGKPAVDKAAAP